MACHALCAVALACAALIVARWAWSRLTAPGLPWLRGRVVVVTGAASGIGRAVALLCARHGARLVISDIREDRLPPVREECLRLGAQGVATQRTDVTSRDDCHALVEAATAFGGGGIDLLALIAGVSMDFPFAETTERAASLVLGTNLLGPAWLAQAALPALEKARGRVLFISSMSSLLPRARRSWYSCSKAAVSTFFQNVRYELEPLGISVTEGLPGFVNTEMAAGVSRLDADGRSLGAGASARSGGASLGFGMVEPERVAQEFVSAAVARRRRVACPAWYDLMVVARFLCPWGYDLVLSGKQKKNRKAN